MHEDSSKTRGERERERERERGVKEEKDNG